MASIIHLPPEVLLVIFKNLSFRCIIENCAKVCVKWQSVAAKYFFQPYLEKLTNYDQEFCDILKKLGWSDKSSNPEKILSFYNIFEVSNYPGRVLVMCGSGPHERDAKGNIDFEKEDRTRIAEVIDFLDPNFKKVISNGNFPIRDHCFGGFLNVTAAQCGDSINNIQPFFGGGFAERGSQKDVFIFNGSKTKTTMKFCRSEAACAKIKGDGYWIFGGSDEDYASLNSTELILYDSTNDSWNVHVSAELPFPIYGHCAVNFEDKYIYLIGGISGGNYDSDSDLDEDEQEEPVTEDRTWVIDLKNLDFKCGPSLRMARQWCQAAVMKSRDRMVIVVAGGRNGHDTLDSVEILDPESGEGWKPGPKLPFRLERYAMISSPNENGVIIIGGYIGRTFDEIKEDPTNDEEPSHYLIELNGDTMEWRILDQKLERGRHSHIAIPIPYVFDLERLEISPENA